VAQVGWIWLDLAKVTSEFNRIYVVSFTDTCRIVGSSTELSVGGVDLRSETCVTSVEVNRLPE
jgi:hypothetical protein